MKTVDLSLETFQDDHDFYGNVSLLITIKSFDLQAIRERYIKSKQNKNNRSGSVNRRKVTLGGLAQLTIENGKITSQDVILKLREPRGIDLKHGVFALSSENKVYVIDRTIYEINNPWFSYIHTVDLCPFDRNKILISSSGYDCLFEYNFKRNERLYEWFAWENGFNSGMDPETGNKIFVTRKEDEHIYYSKNNIEHIYVSNPAKQILPTAKRTAFINSALYDPKKTDTLIATFFHEGAVYGINKFNNTAETLMTRLKNPHGGRRLADGILATSTGSGEVYLVNKQKRIFSFSNLPGKPSELKDVEWIQNSTFMGSNIISIDSNRNAFVIFDPAKKIKSIIPFDANWAVQDLVIGNLSDHQKNLIKSI